jgi:O-antigen ligase
MTNSMGGALLRRLTEFFWVLLLLSLPVTSFPFFPGNVGGTTLVRPLAFYPLIPLLLLFTLPALWKFRLPRTFLPLIGFVLVALAGGLLSLSTQPPESLGVSLSTRLFRNLVTLGFGVALYLTISLYPRTRLALHGLLRWLYLGMGLALFWGTLQVVYVVRFSQPYFDLLSRVQSLVSTRRLFEQRISGLTYEPNWFAEQICFLLLPWLLPAVLSNTTIFRWRYRRLTVEVLLTLWAIFVLLFTFSRVGLFILLVLVGVTVLYLRPRPQKLSYAGLRTPTRWMETVGVLLILLVVIMVAGLQNGYFSRLWRYWTEDTNQSFFEYIAFDQRFTYWETAGRMFVDYPLLGIGVGNFVFYFDDYLEQRPLYTQPELIRQITPTDNGFTRLVTSKNLYVRLLAETGIVGSVLFLAFLLSMVVEAFLLRSAAHPEGQYWSNASRLALIVFAIGALSYDSFALPNMWVVFGMITAAARVFSAQAEPETA